MLKTLALALIVSVTPTPQPELPDLGLTVVPSTPATPIPTQSIEPPPEQVTTVSTPATSIPTITETPTPRAWLWLPLALR